jgi:formamidopyrimidine-DNA glycosylase
MLSFLLTEITVSAPTCFVFEGSVDQYDREDEACSTKGCTGIIKRITQSGRSSFFCPQSQR